MCPQVDHSIKEQTAHDDILKEHVIHGGEPVIRVFVDIVQMIGEVDDHSSNIKR